MPQNFAEMLRSHVRAHNWSVITSSLVAFVVAGIGWLIFFVFGYWVAMISANLHRGISAVPVGYGQLFLLVAGGALALAGVEAWLFSIERPIDRRSVPHHLYDIIMFVPRTTVAGVINFFAWVWLPKPELAFAAKLLDRLRLESRIPMHELPLEIPWETVRRRVLSALEVTQLTEIRSEYSVPVLRWSALAPESFRLLANDTDDEMTRMRRASVLKKENALPGAQDHPALGDRDDL